MDNQQAKDSFLKLILDNKGIIIKICNSYCTNMNYREDLAQEIIIHLWRSREHFNNSHKFSTWMYRVALNVAISFYRKEKTTISSVSFAGALPDIEDKADAADEVEENITLLQRFINDLNELDKALMILFLEEKSYGEIADILGISETNVGTKISRIKKRIKQNFSALNK